MAAPTAVDGMQAAAEVRAHARELQRRAQEALLQAAAVVAVVLLLAARSAIEHDGVTFAVVDEFGCQDAASAHRVAFLVNGFINDIEAVALAQVGVEVDPGAEDRREL